MEQMQKEVEKIENHIKETDDKLSQSIDKLNQAIFDLKISVNDLKNEVKGFNNYKMDTKAEIEAIKARLCVVEEAGKINWINLVKNWIVSLLGGGAIVFAVLEALGKLK